MDFQTIATVGGVFLSVALATGSLMLLLVGAPGVSRRRLAALVKAGGPQPTAADSALVDEPSERAQRLSRLIPKSPKEMGRLHRRLAHAGYHQFEAVVIYGLAELLLPVLFGLTALMIFGWGRGIILAGLAGVIGYLLPSLVVGQLIARRKKEIQNGLADALDLLIVCIEAGSGVDQAIMKASEELRVSYPSVAEELHLMHIEVRAGKPRLEAFKNFAERTKVDDVRSLVAMLVQTDRFGTSLAQALRTHAVTLRTKRRQRAEEKAMKLGAKLVFPLVFFLFPALFVVVLGPAAIQYVRVFRPHVIQQQQQQQQQQPPRP
jgi:tight adherence protein C